MKRINVLMTASGGLGAFSILKALQCSDLDFILHTTDIQDNPPMSKFSIYHKIPPFNHSDYLNTLLDLCSDNNIDVLLPLYTDELPIIAKAQKKFQDIGTVPVISGYNSIVTAIDKLACYRFLKKNGIRVPQHYLARNIGQFEKACQQLGYPDFPICFKPSRYPQGGGRGFRILDASIASDRIFYDRPGSVYDTYEHIISVMEHCNKFPELMVMEYLPFDEYSVYVLAKSGRSLYIVPNLRKSLMMMYSWAAEIVKDDKVIALSKKITELFSFTYNINIQCKYDRTNEPAVVEINPRIAGTIILPVAAGLNLPVMAIKMALGEKIPLHSPIKYNYQMQRYWSEIFIHGNKVYTIGVKL